MPLPLPNLDTRRWADLVEEGRALIPRYASRWTDHNVHDPGITLIELFAWMIEGDIYRGNHISNRHRRKFLRLIGFPPRLPEPARVVLSCIAKPGLAAPQRLPAGLALMAKANSPRPAFRTLTELTVVEALLTAVQTTPEGITFTDQTRAHRERFGFPPWGAEPAVAKQSEAGRQPALYLGFNRGLPADTPVRLWFQFANPRSGEAERRRIIEEAGPGNAADQALRHHSIRSAWDYFDGNAWQTLDEKGGVSDETRGFTLDGAVTVRLPTAMSQPGAFGAAGETGAPKQLFYLRCRLVGGPLDFAPRILDILMNAVEAEQVSPLRSTFSIRPGVVPLPGEEPIVGGFGHLAFELDDSDALTSLAFTPTGDAPPVTILAYAPASPSSPGSLTATLALVGRGSGLPGHSVVLAEAPIAHGAVRLWTLADGHIEEWTSRPDLDASGRTDAHFTVDAMSSEIRFGDGEGGRVAPQSAAILVSGDVTAAGRGGVTTAASWRLSGADDILNQALLGPGFPQDVEEGIQAIGNAMPGSAGADEEALDHTAGRAVERVWAHERLLQLCPGGGPQTLDDLEREIVLQRAAPTRATTLLDYERLALDVPGAPVARARAWAGLDPSLPCVRAPGTVVVIVVPWLPADRPEASPQLLAAVRRYLERRRLVGTRLLTVGPSYLRVSVRATIAIRSGARAERVLGDVAAALNGFLHPLRGGPAGRGWPFGRDVYRSEILEVIDRRAGVDHVENLELVGGTGAPQCGNLCVGPLVLVTPGTHELVLYSERGSHVTPHR